MRAAKHLVATEALMNVTAHATGLAGVGLVNNQHLAPRVLACLVGKQALLEAVVRL